MNLLQFMSESPFLMFFLALILGEMICGGFKAVGGKYRKRCWECGRKVDPK